MYRLSFHRVGINVYTGLWFVGSTTYSSFIEEDRNMKRKVIKLATMGAVAVITTLSVAVGNAVAKDKLVIAVPTFLT